MTPNFLKLFGLILIALFGALTYYKDTKAKEKEKIPKHFDKIIYSIIVLTLLINAIDIYQSSYVERRFWYTGEIRGSESTSPIIKNGNALFNVTTQNGILFNMLGDPIKVWIYDGKLNLYTIVRNEKGEQMVAVIGNNFVVNPNTVSDFNYDDNALEVLDKSGDVVLQIQMQGDGILFFGKFYLRDGSRVGIGNNIIEIRPKGEELKLSTEPIFIYPGKDNLGLRK